MSVDLRTRRDSEATAVDPVEFFSRSLSAALLQSTPFIAPWLAANTPSDCTVECAGNCWHLHYCNGGVAVMSGASATGLHVRLSAEDLSGLVNDFYTPITFFTGGNLDIVRGELGMFLDWWLVLRAALDQRPIHMPGAIDFPAADGGQLDLTRSFTLDDSVESMRHFLQTAGFLHLRGVFTEAEMAAISADMDRFHNRYCEGDGRSWWATTADGERRLVRMQSFDTYSDATARLLDDERFQGLGDITGDGHTHRGLEDNRIEALVKPIGVTEGLSDLPWHKDCSLGRHSYDCCSMTAGISVTGAGADSGQLRVIAGSHRALMWPALIDDHARHGLPVIDLPTETGDVTLHLSCTQHMAQAPTARERRVMYTGFRLPAVAIDSSTDSRARINRVREAAYRTVSQ